MNLEKRGLSVSLQSTYQKYSLFSDCFAKGVIELYSCRKLFVLQFEIMYTTILIVALSDEGEHMKQ